MATLRTLLTRPVYEGTAQLLIERSDPTVLNFKEVQQVDAGRDDYYQTQYKLLQSRSLARNVIEQLNLLADARVRRPARRPTQVHAILAQPPGESRDMESGDRRLPRAPERAARSATAASSPSR